jgi:hypothetical protein
MEFIKNIINFLSDPKILITLAAVLLFVSLKFPGRFYTNRSAKIVFGFMFLFLILSVLDQDFRLIVTKPDNVPIVGMLFLVPFFTWFAMREAVRNDERSGRGEQLIEQEETAEKVLTWPDLVYTELICLVLCTVLLIGWSVALKAPIEEPANPTASPNPAKAPWYFLGLQELLHYFPPIVAGVLLPTLVVLSLAVIPYARINLTAGPLWAGGAHRRALGLGAAVVLLAALFGVFECWPIVVPTLLIAAAMFLARGGERGGGARRALARVTLPEWIMTWFVIIASTLTLIGTFFRGPGWSFIWPWSALPPG